MVGSRLGLRAQLRQTLPVVRRDLAGVKGRDRVREELAALMVVETAGQEVLDRAGRSELMEVGRFVAREGEVWSGELRGHGVGVGCTVEHGRFEQSLSLS